MGKDLWNVVRLLINMVGWTEKEWPILTEKVKGKCLYHYKGISRRREGICSETLLSLDLVGCKVVEVFNSNYTFLMLWNYLW